MQCTFIGSVLAALMLASAGCGEVARHVFTPPVVRFRSLDVLGISLSGGQLRVTLQLTNPNPYALRATGGRYQLYTSDSVLVGSGETHDTVRVAAHDSALVRLPVTVSWAALGSAGADAVRTGGASYRVTGDVDVWTPIGSYAVPVNARGEARLPARP